MQKKYILHRDMKAFSNVLVHDTIYLKEKKLNISYEKINTYDSLHFYIISTIHFQTYRSLR